MQASPPITNQTAAFDSYHFVRQLIDNGMTEQLAKVLAEDKARQVQYLNANLVTQENLAAVEAGLKKDLAAVEAGLKKDIAVVEANLKTEIARVEAGLQKAISKTNERITQVEANLKSDLIKWMIGIGMGFAAMQMTLMFWLLDGLVVAA